MASWNELKNFIFSNYKSTVEDDIVKLVFGLDDGRSQMVLVHRIANSNSGEEWVGISSPIGDVGAVSIENAARLAYSMLCGGIVIIGERVFLHHAAPLVNLDTNEFVRPMDIVVQNADRIEKELLRKDVS